MAHRSVLNEDDRRLGDAWPEAASGLCTQRQLFFFSSFLGPNGQVTHGHSHKKGREKRPRIRMLSCVAMRTLVFRHFSCHVTCEKVIHDPPYGFNYPLARVTSRARLCRLRRWNVPTKALPPFFLFLGDTWPKVRTLAPVGTWHKAASLGAALILFFLTQRPSNESNFGKLLAKIIHGFK